MLYTNKKWLHKEFIIKNKSAAEIATKCKTTPVTIRSWAKKFGFKRRRYGSKYLNDSYFEKINTEQKAYWLGFIAADGSIQNKKGARKLAISIDYKDHKHLELFKKHIQSEHKIYHIRRWMKKDKYKWYSHAVQLDLSSLKLVNDLIKHGITTRKSLTLKPPVGVPKNLIRHWIRGYFDGDGCIRLSKNGKHRLRASIVCSKHVAKFICANYKSSMYKNKNTWVVSISGKKCYFLYKSMYNNSTVCLNRKKKIFNKEI